jgi:hypothetical protein
MTIITINDFNRNFTPRKDVIRILSRGYLSGNLFNISFMKASPAFRFLFFLVLVTVLGGWSSVAQTATCTRGITFGTRPERGSPCVGLDICEDELVGGTSVTFSTSSDYSNSLTMTFSLSELQQNQPDQVAYFTSGSYMFQADYCLSSDPNLAALSLPANSWILTTSNSTVQINGDVVTVYIMYSVVASY